MKALWRLKDPIACWILAWTSSLVTRSLHDMVSCGSTPFPWLVFIFVALLWGPMIYRRTGRWMWKGSASVIFWNCQCSENQQLSLDIWFATLKQSNWLIVIVLMNKAGSFKKKKRERQKKERKRTSNSHSFHWQDFAIKPNIQCFKWIISRRISKFVGTPQRLCQQSHNASKWPVHRSTVMPIAH